MAFIWSLYVLWGVINAYFFDVPPSERFQNIVDFVTPPKQTTVGAYIHKAASTPPDKTRCNVILSSDVDATCGSS